MNFNKLERKYGRYAIHDLTKWMIVTYVIGYIFYLSPIDVLSFLTLDPYAILHGQVWRIFTWVINPPSSPDIFTLIMLFFYYSIGTTLERTWGEFKYNLYIFSGIFFTILGAFVIYGVGVLTGWLQVSDMLSVNFSTYYINLSIFLAFAACYPDMQVLLYFIVPVKIKWLAYFDLALLGFSFVQSDVAGRAAIIASLLNFILFFFGTRNLKAVSPKEIHRKKVYHQEVQRNTSVTRHKCAICGRTEKDGDDLEFRFCSKCEGNYEYCQDHLFTHKHVKR